MDSQSLNLSFKGDRTYLHGSDIFNAIDKVVRGFDNASYLSRLAFRRFARRDCNLWWERPASSETLVAQGNIHNDGTRQPFWVTESSRPVTERRDYDEVSVVNPAVIDGQKIVLEQRSIYTPIEEIIALTKRLSYELTPDIDGKWVFGQLDLCCSLPNDYSRLTIERKSEVQGRFCLNRIDIDNHHVGDIRFIVGTP